MNSILHGITRAIHAEFPDWEIHTDKLKQDVEEPCFFVQPIYNNQKRFPCNRVKFETNFLIQFLCERMSNKEKVEIGNKLHEILEIIELDDGTKLRGRNRNSTVYEYCVNFSVDYNGFMVEIVETEDFVDNITIHIGG